MKEKKLWKIILLGLQHVCVMYGGAVAVPLIIAPAIGLTEQQLIYLISFDLFTCGIATLIQVWGNKFVGIKLPALMAVSFIVVEPIIAIGKIHSITGVIGAVIVSGVVVTIVAQFIGKLIKFFPPVVTGSVVLIIGTSLMPVAMSNVAGGTGSANYGHIENFMLAVFTLLCFLILNYVLKGFMKAISVLIAMVLGTLVAGMFGMVDFKALSEAAWLTPLTPFYFGTPTFQLSSILTMSIIAILIMIESVGVFLALGEFCDREIKENDIKKGVRAEGISAIISGVFNSFNHSTFSQNVGLVFLTKVKQRVVLVAAGVILILLGFLPKIAALTTMIPKPVLGGAMIPMFGMLIAASLQMIAKSDMKKSSNQLVVAVGVGLGLAVKGAPDAFKGYPELVQLLCSNGVVMGTLTMFLLNLFLNRTSKDDLNEQKHEQRTTDNLEIVKPVKSDGV
ncbi:nucleobase:cation symporter-2 family protein [Thermoflavimicrobium daqui]|uniref:nucleobase:cation symporter-2 family protein n=1 Tax=Thermoflavimicrobium daqui TaxID=2137476 RepID=UPI001F0C3E67|nr:nucleobase:cation symporter-2 family protein [Thermoflavimicrobium daqui]